MDIQSASSAANLQSTGAGQSEARESRVNEDRQAKDNTVERKEAEPSEKRNGVGDRVDIKA